MLGNYREANFEMQGENDENEIDSRLNRQDEVLVNNDEIFRSYLNANFSENSSLTVVTSRAINSEISSKVSRHLEELKPGLNAQILEVSNSAIAEKVLPSTENAIRPTKTTLNAKWDLRSHGLHHSEFEQATQKRDLRSDGQHHSEFAQATQKNDFTSNGLHPSKIRPIAQNCDPRSDRPHSSKVSQIAQEPQNVFPRLITTSSNRNESL